MAQQKKPDIEKINELVQLMIDNDLVELEIIDGDSKIHLKRPDRRQQVVAPMPVASPMAPAGGQPPAVGAEQPPAEQEELVDITSPLVGTFYSSPSPDSEPFVRVGSEVGPETVVCIIEAMKVMNEVKAETGGTIAKVMVANGEAVEFGQVLYKVRPG